MVTFLPWWVSALLLNLVAVLVGIGQGVREARAKRARRAEEYVRKYDEQFRPLGFYLAEIAYRPGWFRESGFARWDHRDGRYGLIEW